MSEPICKIDCFCNVCGHSVVTKDQLGSMSDTFLDAYKQYFQIELIKDQKWAPKNVCHSCYATLMQWKSNKRLNMPFGVPMIWTNPGEHKKENCYGCTNYEIGLNKRKGYLRTYEAVPSVQLPIKHRPGIIPVPIYISQEQESVSTGATTSTEVTAPMDFSSEYDPLEGQSSTPKKSAEPILINQAELDTLVANLLLTQKKSEELARFLKQKNMLTRDTKVTAYRKRQKELQTFFVVNTEKTFAYCTDIPKLMESIGITYIKDDWRLFIDSSLISLKVVLLHKTNQKPSVPIAYSTDTRETFEKLKDILDVVKYEEHKWRICCDLKVVSLITGLTADGRPKYPCFLCDWDSRYGEGKDARNQYKKTDWRSRIGRKWPNDNRKHESLVSELKILLPLLHIKLGVAKNFLKCVVKRPEVYNLLKKIFPRLSKAKLMEGVVNGPDIRKLIKRSDFDGVLKGQEKVAWLAIKEVIAGVLGKHRADNYKAFVEKMLTSFNKIGVNMSYKIHLLHQHLEYLAHQLPTESDEQGERHHQTALPFEIR